MSARCCSGTPTLTHDACWIACACSQLASDIQKNTNIAQSFLLYAPPEVFATMTLRSAIVQDLPFLVTTLEPAIRTV